MGSHYSWKKRSFLGGDPRITSVSSLKATTLHLLLSSVQCEANITDKNALMATMAASDDEAVKVPVFCHRLGQVLPTLSKKSVFPCRQIVQ